MVDSTQDLNGLVMFITGAGRGIGKGIAEVAAHAGADVAIDALTNRYVDDLARRWRKRRVGGWCPSLGM